MTIGSVQYGIGYLPKNCLAYSDGYRYGAYRKSLKNKSDMHIVEFFKTENEIQKFVNTNPEYGKEA